MSVSSPQGYRLPHIPEFDGLRAFLALWVVAGHIGTSIAQSLSPFPQNLANTAAVDVFIILSGFVITNLRWTRPEGYRVYIARRWLRLFPAYLLALCVSIAMLGISETALQRAPVSEMTATRLEFIQAAHEHFMAHLLAHVTLLQGVVPSSWLPKSAFTFIGQAWSVSMEWQFYLIAPFLLGLLMTPRRLMGACAFALVCIGLSGVQYPGFIGTKIWYFAIGIASFHAWRNVASQTSFKLRLWQRIAALAAFLLALSVHSYAIALWNAIWMSVVLERSGSGKLACLICAVLKSTWVQYLGIRSYSFYLWHMVALNLCLYVLGYFTFYDGMFSGVLALSTIGLTVIVCHLSYRYLERPAIEYGRKLANC